MQDRYASFTPWLIAGVIAVTPLAGIRAETTGETYHRLADKISYLTYGDFLWQRTPSYFKDDPELKTSWDNLELAMAVPTDLAELTTLANHPEPKVRTLAMMRLYNPVVL